MKRELTSPPERKTSFNRHAPPGPLTMSECLRELNKRVLKRKTLLDIINQTETYVKFFFAVLCTVRLITMILMQC